MAPHALIDSHDSSGYYPSIKSIAWLKSAAAHQCLRPSITDAANLEKDVSLKRLQTLTRQAPYVWHLSPEEIENVEESVRSFSGMHCPSKLQPNISLEREADSGLPLNAINPRSFPLTQGLRSKLKDVLKIVYGIQQFLVISGLRSSRHNDIENVIIHTGLSSHVGSKRGMAGREGGDNTVLR